MGYTQLEEEKKLIAMKLIKTTQSQLNAVSQGPMITQRMTKGTMQFSN